MTLCSFPGRDENSCTDVQLVDGSLTIGDKSQISTYTRAKYGILDPVILCNSLMYALVAVRFLTNRLKLYVFYVEILAYILKKTSNSAKPDELLFKTIATATLQRDRLFHIDDSTKYQIKMMVLHNVNIGTQVSYAEIKDLHLGEFDT